MNRERAEIHLRLLAETGLRQVAQAEPGSADERPDQWTYERLARVTRALLTVRAVDADLVEDILADFDLGLTVREPGGLSQASLGGQRARRRRTRRWNRPVAGGGTVAVGSSVAVVRAGAGTSKYSFSSMSVGTSRPPSPSQPTSPSSSLAQPAPAPAAPDRSAPWRVVPVGQVIPIADGDARGELCLLAFAQTAAGARLTTAGWLDGVAAGELRPSAGGPPRPPWSPFQRLAAVADQGAGYDLGFSGGGVSSGDQGRAEWAGTYGLSPDPPDQLRWLEVSVPGGPVTRIDLAPRIPPPDVTVTQLALTPGEVLLDTVAAELLAHGAAGVPGRRQPLTTAGDVLAALRAADALPSSSPVPGQLAWLCANLAGTDGTQRPAGVPEPWLSMLAHRQRQPRHPVPASHGVAAVAVELPELDRARFAVLSLHHDDASSVLQLLATGIALDEGWPDIRGVGPMPALWLRDHRDQWHATRMKGFSAHDHGETMLELELMPPVKRDTPWLELRVAGQRAQVRARLPLRWT